MNTPLTNPIQLGKIYGEPIDVYHSVDAVSNSRLKDFRFRPLYYWRRHVARILPPEDSKALRDGRAFDCYLLDGPDVFAKNYVVLPEGAPKRPTRVQLEAKKPSEDTVAAIAWWSEFEAGAAGKTVLTAADFEQIKMLESACRKSPEVWVALQGERQVTWRVRFGNVLPPVQSRPDVWHPNGMPGICDTPCFCDLKTTASLTDGEFGSFQSAVEKGGYYRQAGLAVALATQILPPHERPLDGFRWFFAAVEKDKDVGGAAQLYELDQEDIVRGYNESMEDLKKLRECYETGVWPGTLGGVQRIGLKAWRRKAIDEALARGEAAE